MEVKWSEELFGNSYFFALVEYYLMSQPYQALFVSTENLFQLLLSLAHLAVLLILELSFVMTQMLIEAVACPLFVD